MSYLECPTCGGYEDHEPGCRVKKRNDRIYKAKIEQQNAELQARLDKALADVAALREGLERQPMSNIKEARDWLADLRAEAKGAQQQISLARGVAAEAKSKLKKAEAKLSAAMTFIAELDTVAEKAGCEAIHWRIKGFRETEANKPRTTEPVD